LNHRRRIGRTAQFGTIDCQIWRRVMSFTHSRHHHGRVSRLRRERHIEILVDHIEKIHRVTQMFKGRACVALIFNLATIRRAHEIFRARTKQILVGNYGANSHERPSDRRVKSAHVVAPFPSGMAKLATFARVTPRSWVSTNGLAHGRSLRRVESFGVLQNRSMARTDA
jgi:hypothetical protein